MIAARPRQSIIPDAELKTLPAPVGGWNAIDSLESMPPEDAPILTNWVPTPTTCINRFGFTQFATGFAGQVESVMAYAGLTGSKLIAAESGNLYDISAGGAVGVPLSTGNSNNRWQYTNISNSGNSYLYMVNGADKAKYFNGTVISTPTISGVDSATFIQINLHKNRLWFVQKNTLNAYYLATSAIAGPATQFPLQGVVQKGGYLVAMATWTIDAGYGIDDYATFITSKGEILVYSGSDPTDATTWGLIGDFQIGSPIGTRCYMKYQGDVAIITYDGLFLMSSALQSSRTNPQVALSYKIQTAMSMATSIYGPNFGWQVFNFPKQNLLWVNVPVNEGGNQQQYTMVTLPNKSWCNFTGWNANCWELFNDNPYFGGNGFVGQAWNGLADNGANIVTYGLQAFNYFDTPLLKQFTMIRPFLNTNGSPNILASLNIDFSLANTTSPLSFSPITYATWDSGVWDTSVWGADLVLTNAWQGANGIGNAAAVCMQSASQGIEVQWAACTVVWRKGGIL